MQERYLGDIHDYYKFLFLKNLSIFFQLRIGCNWYLVRPDDIGHGEIKKNDGEKRSYLHKNIDLDIEILEEFLPLKNFDNRIMENFIKNTHLKKFIKFYHKHLDHTNRNQWFEQSIQNLKNCNYVFLDPDNGLISNGSKISSKKKIKYILTSELKKMYQKKLNIIFCQFQSFNKKHKEMLKSKRDMIMDEIGLKINSNVLRNRVSPNTYYISLLQKGYEEKFNNFLIGFSKKNQKVEIIKI